MMRWIWRSWKRLMGLNEIEHIIVTVDNDGKRWDISKRELVWNSYDDAWINYHHKAWLRQQYTIHNLYAKPVAECWIYIDKEENTL